MHQNSSIKIFSSTNGITSYGNEDMLVFSTVQTVTDKMNAIDNIFLILLLIILFIASLLNHKLDNLSFINK